MSKPFDIIVYGATGFTGALVAQYLATENDSALGSPSALKWAIAGRSKAKLESVKQTLKEKLPSVNADLIDAIPIVVADSDDEDSLVAMVKQTKVVLSIVGPYKLYGSLLVKACAENGVHYCDLTGEVIWIDEMVAKYQSIAEKTGAIIVNCCGFESVPSDLTTFLIADAIMQKKNSTTSKIDLYFTKVKGEASGGTMASVFTIMETSTTDQLKRSRHPFFLTDEKTRNQKTSQALIKPNSTSAGIQYDKTMKKWSSLFLGGSVNQAMVHRSNYLMKEVYGDNFVYRERLAIGGFLHQVAATCFFVTLGVMLYFRPTRALVKKLSPKPGQGPSEQVMKTGGFIAEAAGYSEDGKLAVKAKTVGVGDPGYAFTSKVISECAFCLAKDEHGKLSLRGGFFTPASAFGHKLADRLGRKKFMTVELEMQ